MITFTMGLVVGAFLVWLRLRVVSNALKAATAQRLEINKALRSSSELLKKCSEVLNAKQQEQARELEKQVVLLKEPFGYAA